MTLSPSINLPFSPLSIYIHTQKPHIKKYFIISSLIRPLKIHFRRSDRNRARVPVDILIGRDGSAGESREASVAARGTAGEIGAAGSGSEAGDRGSVGGGGRSAEQEAQGLRYSSTATGSFSIF